MSDHPPSPTPDDQRPADRPAGPGSDHQPADVTHENPAHDAAHAAADHNHGHGHEGGHEGGHDHPAHLAHHFETPEQQMESSKLGMWVFLATEILMFGGLFCAYSIYRANNPDVFLFAHKALDTFWGAVNTAVLLASSFTMAWGVRAAQLGQRGLLVVLLCLTLLGGLGFMTIKTIEYKSKWDHQLWVGSGNAFYQENWQISDKDNARHSADYIEKKAGHNVGGHDGEYGHGEDHAAAAGTEASTKIPGGPDHADESSHLRNQDHTNAPPDGPDPLAEGDGEQGESGHDDHAGHSAPESAAAAAEAEAHRDTHGNEHATPPVPPAPQRRVAEIVPGSTVARPGGSPGGVVDDLVDNPQINLSVGESLITGPGAVQAAHHGSHYPKLTELDALETSRTHIFFQIYYMMTGLHGIHVLVGMGLISWITFLAGSPTVKALVGPVASAVLGLDLIFLGSLIGFPLWLIASIALSFVIAGGVAVLHFSRLGKFGGPAFGPEYYTPVDLVGLYWHLVDLIWIFLFPLLYLIH